MSKLSDFTIIKKLGDGAYSSVYKVKRQDDELHYALKKVKMLNLSDKEKENALNEVRILASINQPNVVSYKEAFIDEPSSSLCLVMEYADNGDVFQKICNYQKRETYIKEKKIWYVFIQIVRGLKALHDRKILHRDMKSANIFLYKDMQAKLGDLNVSKVVKKGLSYTQTGTPYYASPEVWKDQPYDSKSDIWSLGCVLYEMCALVPPFRADDMQGLYKKVIKGKYPRIPEHFSQEMATVIKFMLQVSPSYRPSCDQILSLPIIESLIKKFFPNEVAAPTVEEIANNETLLKTIRLSKNIFSLTERLPKAKYRSPKAASDPSLLQNQINQKSTKQLHTIQPNESEKQIGIQKPQGIRNKSRLQEYMDHQNNGTERRVFEEEDLQMDKMDSNENSINAHQRAKALKRNKINKGQGSDLELNDPAQQSKQMRIASQGMVHSDKDGPSRSDHNELASIDDKSFDPDAEPRKEGTNRIKHSPSVAELLPNIDGLSDGGSIGGSPNENSLKRNQTKSKSPRGLVGNILDNEDDGDMRTLNRDNKHSRSNRKLAKIQQPGQKGMLRIVQEDDNTSGGSSIMGNLPLSPNRPYGGNDKNSSLERSAKLILNQQNPQSRQYNQMDSQGGREPVKLMNVYQNNQQQKRQNAVRGMLNKKASEEKLHNQNYQQKKQMEYRLKSNMRGQDQQQYLGRNQSKQTLQLPEIHTSNMLKQQNAELQMLGSPKSRKNLQNQGMIQSPQNYHIQGGGLPQVLSPSPSQDAQKNKNYYAYDMIEKRGQKNIDKIQNDLSKIYVMQGGNNNNSMQQINDGITSPNNQQLQYNRKAGSPINNQGSMGILDGLAGSGLNNQNNQGGGGNGYFHQRNQSQDVGGTKSFKNKIANRKRGVMLQSPQMHGEAQQIFEGQNFEQEYLPSQQAYLNQMQINNQQYNSPASGGNRFRQQSQQ